MHDVYIRLWIDVPADAVPIDDFLIYAVLAVAVVAFLFVTLFKR